MFFLSNEQTENSVGGRMDSIPFPLYLGSIYIHVLAKDFITILPTQLPITKKWYLISSIQLLNYK